MTSQHPKLSHFLKLCLWWTPCPKFLQSCPSLFGTINKYSWLGGIILTGLSNAAVGNATNDWTFSDSLSCKFSATSLSHWAIAFLFSLPFASTYFCFKAWISFVLSRYFFINSPLMKGFNAWAVFSPFFLSLDWKIKHVKASILHF